MTLVDGPYSHVFEEVTAGSAVQIIEETNIKSILRKHGIFDETIYLFTAEKESDRI